MIKYFKYFLLVAFLLGFVACSDSQPSPDFIGSFDVSPLPDQNPADGGGSTGGGDTGGTDGGGTGGATDIQTVGQLIANISLPAADSEGFFAPDSAQISQFQTLITALLDGEGSGHEQTLSDLGYELTTIEFDDGSDMAWALHEPTSTGGGTFLINPTTSSNLIIEVPHPLADSNTLDEGAFLFQDIKARALYIAGTHRCANASESPCSGTTDACGAVGPYRISDVAHAITNFFHAAHVSSDDFSIANIFVSLHSYQPTSGEPTAILSNGTKASVGDLAYINELADALDSLMSGSEFANSCNRLGDPDFDRCGEENVQGRYTNGSANECTETPAGYNGRFIHMEQTPFLSDDSAGWQIVADALNSVFN